MIGVVKAADLSDCGRFRWTLSRKWDGRPSLLVVMTNPSTADGMIDDQTITLLCYLASWNGFGSFTVVNMCPLRCSDPRTALEMLRTRATCSIKPQLTTNETIIRAELRDAADVLLAWGALAADSGGYDQVIVDIIRSVRPGARLFTLGLTADGYPIHPMARGKHKVPKDRKFIPWSK